MALRGLSLPVGVTKDGRSSISEGEDHASKILVVALSDCDNNNAFQQDRGLRSGDVTFSVTTLELRARIQSRLQELFRQFQKDGLFSLLQNTVQWEENEAQELILSFSYINLETDERKTFSHKFNGRG